ncbi:hypothetical protein [Streptomyces sp. NPDC056061]|uniref:hypothetical protein n=1 Tax=Streptomyces sp. NPDC056061 TaxID=3345700 RepID=UPI0035E0CCBC
MHTPELSPALTLWGYSSDSCLERPKEWELARLALQAGDYLAQYTDRPTPADAPPKNPEPDGRAIHPLVADGYVRVRGWEPIAPCESRGHSNLDPVVIARRMESNPRAIPTAVRQLLERVTRVQHHTDVPDGVALALGVHNLPDMWWGYVKNGWLSALAGKPGHSLLFHLPPVPHKTPGLARRQMAEAMTWLADQPGLREVRDAFHNPQPDDVIDDALHVLHHNTPTVGDLAARTQLARLLTLYNSAVGCRDLPLIQMVADLRR